MAVSFVALTETIIDSSSPVNTKSLGDGPSNNFAAYWFLATSTLRPVDN